MSRKYKVLSALEHNGKPYAEGAQIKLTDEHAEQLLAAGAVTVIERAAVSAPVATGGEPQQAAQTGTQGLLGDDDADAGADSGDEDDQA